MKLFRFIRPVKISLHALIGMLFLSACGDRLPDIVKLEGFAQGTGYHISAWAEPAVDRQLLQDAVQLELAEIDKRLSNYRPDSTIEIFNNQTSTDSQSVGSEIVALFKIAQNVSQASQGCYDLTIKPLFDLWGFQGDELTIPDAGALGQALLRVGMDKVSIVDDTHLKKPAEVRLDLSSIGQGYSVEQVSRVLEKQGVFNYLIEIGGELKTQGHKPDGTAWRIAVEKPLPGEQRLMKVLTMPKDRPMAVMTSGTYRHYFDVNGQRYSHILDARTGKPISHDLVAVTVLHDNPTVADAWSTALLCVGRQQGLQLADAENLQVLFVEQQGAELVQSKSKALSASNISIE